jgi:hypothetical protein
VDGSITASFKLHLHYPNNDNSAHELLAMDQQHSSTSKVTGKYRLSLCSAITWQSTFPREITHH